MRSAEELAIPAYLASVHSVLPLIRQIRPSTDMDDAMVDCIAEWSVQSDADAPVEDLARFQKCWDEPLFKKKHAELLDRSSDKDKARLLASAEKESGSWLNALPSPVMGNLLDDDSLRIAVALRLGASICEPHDCRCGVTVDTKGHHGLTCKFSAGRFSRHTALNDIVKRALSSASIPSNLEPLGIARDDGKHPDGVTLISWKEGKALLWDVTVVDTLATSYLRWTVKEAGKAAENAEERKIVKYSNLAGRYHFQPLGFETLGAWGPSAKALISTIGKKVRERSGEPRSLEFLRQRISIEIQRGNAASIMGTLPTSRGLGEVYYILDFKPVLV
jgi:hypothetical protein